MYLDLTLNNSLGRLTDNQCFYIITDSIYFFTKNTGFINHQSVCEWCVIHCIIGLLMKIAEVADSHVMHVCKCTQTYDSTGKSVYRVVSQTKVCWTMGISFTDFYTHYKEAITRSPVFVAQGSQLYFRLDIILVKGLSKHTLNTYFSGMKIDPKYAFLHAFFLICVSRPFQNLSIRPKTYPFFQFCTFKHP